MSAKMIKEASLTAIKTAALLFMLAPWAFLFSVL